MIGTDFGLVCLSRNRHDTIRQQSYRYFPEATVCVAESERDAYHAALPAAKILTHPDAVTGLGPVRQWVLDHVESRWVVTIPDDIVGCYGLTWTYASRWTDTKAIIALLRNTAECAEDAGAKLFGFNQAWDVRKYSPFQPFNLNGWVDGPMGVGTRELRYDTSLVLHPDVDFALQHLLKYRLVWQDNRFAFSHDRWKQAGGNAGSRSKANHEREFAYLERKWGAHYTVNWAKGTFLSHMHVERKQHV